MKKKKKNVNLLAKTQDAGENKANFVFQIINLLCGHQVFMGAGIVWKHQNTMSSGQLLSSLFLFCIYLCSVDLVLWFYFSRRMNCALLLYGDVSSQYFFYPKHWEKHLELLYKIPFSQVIAMYRRILSCLLTMKQKQTSIRYPSLWSATSFDTFLFTFINLSIIGKK